MRLNNLAPASGSKSKAKRLGRGIGSTSGKTAGRGHKGQKARAGGFHKVGFEGGQMPLQRRLPKVGFKSRKKARSTSVTLAQLNSPRLDGVIEIPTLIAAGVVGRRINKIKIINSGELTCGRVLRGFAASKAAVNAIIAAGGRIEA